MPPVASLGQVREFPFENGAPSDGGFAVEPREADSAPRVRVAPIPRRRAAVTLRPRSAGRERRRRGSGTGGGVVPEKSSISTASAARGISAASTRRRLRISASERPPGVRTVGQKDAFLGRVVASAGAIPADPQETITSRNGPNCASVSLSLTLPESRPYTPALILPHPCPAGRRR